MSEIGAIQVVTTDIVFSNALQNLGVYSQAQEIKLGADLVLGSIVKSIPIITIVQDIFLGDGISFTNPISDLGFASVNQSVLLGGGIVFTNTLINLGLVVQDQSILTSSAQTKTVEEILVALFNDIGNSTGLTAEERAKLLSIPNATENTAALLAQAQATPIHSNTKKMNDATLLGSGTEQDKWRG